MLPITIPKAVNPYVCLIKEEEEEDRSYDDDNDENDGNIVVDDDNIVDKIGNTSRFFFIDDPIRRRDPPPTITRGFTNEESIENAMVNDHICSIVISFIAATTIIMAGTIQYSIARQHDSTRCGTASIFFSSS